MEGGKNPALLLFDEFEKDLKKNYNRVLDDSKKLELELLKKENEKIQLDNQISEYTVSILNSTFSLLSSLSSKEEDLNGNAGPSVSNDALKDLLCSLAELVMDEGASAAKDREAEPKKKRRKLDKNSNKVKRSPIKRPLTRSRTKKNKKSRSGLVNPINYPMCLICGPKHRDYSDQKLLAHYNTSHKLALTLENMPRTQAEAEMLSHYKIRHELDMTLETVPRLLQKCHICQESFACTEYLMAHKSLHVDPKFCQYKCKECPQAFVMEKLFIQHKATH